ncbi:MAG: helix-turn-helix domain-containing protein [Ruthenibacterium sp.]
MTIGERIRDRRKQLKLTQTAVIKATSMSSGNLSELENNKYNPSLQTLVLLRSVLQCSLDWLVTGEEPCMNSLNSEPAVSLREQSILSVYRSLNASQQTEVEEYMLYQLQKRQKGPQSFSQHSADGTA